MRKLIFILILVLQLALMSKGALAVETPSQSALGVSPAIVELVLEPGKTSETTVQVFNIVDYPLPIKAFVRNFVLNDTTLISPEDLEASKGIFDVSSWVETEPSDFILQPKEIKEVKLVINTPEEAEPGGHYATVYFQPLLPKEAVKLNSTVLAARVGILNFFIVKGEIIENAYLGDVEVEKFRQFGPVDFKVLFKNEGNVHLLPNGYMEIRDMFGKEVGKADITQVTVLPKSARKLEAAWDKRFLLGKFTAESFVFYGTERHKPVAKKIEFWVIPWLPILITIIFLTAMIGVAIMGRGKVSLILKILLGKTKNSDDYKPKHDGQAKQ